MTELNVPKLILYVFDAFKSSALLTLMFLLLMKGNIILANIISILKEILNPNFGVIKGNYFIGCYIFGIRAVSPRPIGVAKDSSGYSPRE